MELEAKQNTLALMSSSHWAAAAAVVVVAVATLSSPVVGWLMPLKNLERQKIASSQKLKAQNLLLILVAASVFRISGPRAFGWAL